MIGFDGKCSIKKKISSYTMYIFHILGPIFEIYTIKLMPIKCTTFALKLVEDQFSSGRCKLYKSNNTYFSCYVAIHKCCEL